MTRVKKTRPVRRYAVDRGDPLAAVLGFGRRATRTGLLVGFVVATVSHGVFGSQALADPVELRMWSEVARKEIRDFLWSTYDVELVKPPVEPEQEKPEEKEEVKDEVKPAPPVRAAQPTAPVAPPPPAAQAGKVLTALADPNEPVDLTGGGFVTGNADSFVGGVTAAAGTGTVATHSAAASSTGKPGGTGTAARPVATAKPTGPDKSRAAAITTGSNWSSCPFPPEANADQVDYGVVTLIVTVRPDGSARSAQVVSDPGHGFGRAARLCALSKRYAAALDRDGNAIMGTTPPIRVTFTR